MAYYFFEQKLAVAWNKFESDWSKHLSPGKTGDVFVGEGSIVGFFPGVHGSAAARGDA